MVQSRYFLSAIFLFSIAAVSRAPAAAGTAHGDFPHSYLLDRDFVHALVIFAHFSDETTTPTPPAYAFMIFDVDLPGSLRHFYHAMSQGQFDVRGTVLPTRYRSERPAA